MPRPPSQGDGDRLTSVSDGFFALGYAESKNGGKRIRTDDPLLAKQVLYQLSYAPVPFRTQDRHADPAEPARSTANALRGRAAQVAPESRCPATQANPGDFSAPAAQEKWAREDLNLRPHAYQACALTN
jgi:hypothetical protein